MKIIRDIINKAEYDVPSDSEPRTYKVIETKKGEWLCNCFAGSMGRECKHIKFMRNSEKNY